MDNSSLIKDTAASYLDDEEYGDYPKSSLWWDEDYDPPDYYSYIPYDVDYDFDWDDQGEDV